MPNLTRHAAARIRQISMVGLIAAMACAATIALAGTVSFVGSKDNSILANNVNNSNGGGAGIFVGTGAAVPEPICIAYLLSFASLANLRPQR